MHGADSIRNETGERLLSRREVAERWSVSTETVKRRTRDGQLPALYFNQRLIRYRLADITRLEQDAQGGYR